jgi:hypothetical protein
MVVRRLGPQLDGVVFLEGAVQGVVRYQVAWPGAGSKFNRACHSVPRANARRRPPCDSEDGRQLRSALRVPNELYLPNDETQNAELIHFGISDVTYEIGEIETDWKDAIDDAPQAATIRQ